MNPSDFNQKVIKFLRGYIIDPLKHFIRDRKMSYHDCIKFIIWYYGKNNDTEAAEYFKVFKKM